MSTVNHIPDAHEHLNSADKGTSFFFIAPSATTADVPASAKVVEFDSKMTTGAAMHALADNGILSAPVYDATKKAYLGFVDVFDLMSLAVGVDLLMHILPADMVKRPRSEDEFNKSKQITLGEMLADKEGFCPWCPVQEGESFRVVVQLLSTKARRVPVLSKTTGKVVQIISQSQVTALLFERIQAGKVLTESSPGNTGMGMKPVFTVKDSEQARAAFQMMVENSVSSICVVDENGDILTAISTKDIRLLPRLESAGLDQSNLLDLSVREFVALVRKVAEKDGKSHAACVTVELNTPLVTVLGKLAATKVHRVYIQDGHKKPTGVISVSDVMVALEQVQPDHKI